MITRYLAKSIYIHFAFILLVFVGVFFLFDFLSESKQLSFSYTYKIALWQVALRLPIYIYEFIPIVALIASILTFVKLAQRSEFIIIRANLSIFSLAKLVLIIALPLMLLTFAISELLLPKVTVISAQIKQSFLNKVDNRLKSGIWLKHQHQQTVQFIRIGDESNTLVQNHQKTMLKDIYIYQFNKKQQLTDFYYAKQGQVLKQNSANRQGNLWLQDVQKLSFEPQTFTHQVQNYAQLQLATHLNPKFINNNWLKRNSYALNVYELNQYIHFLKNNQEISKSYEINLIKRFCYPILVALLMLFTLPFAYIHARFGKAGIKMFFGILAGLCIYLAYTVFLQLANLNTLSAYTANYLPLIILLITLMLLFAYFNKQKRYYLF